MIKIGFLSNPYSQRNKKGLSEAERCLLAKNDVVHGCLEDMADAQQVLRDFARQEVGLLAISGGDGTVQGILTAVYENGPFERPPPLAVLPRGMTNMIAADVGLRRPLQKSLDRLESLARTGALDGTLVSRKLIRLDNINGHPAQYGMFFGGAGIYRAIQACRSQVHRRGLKSEAAASLTMVGLLTGLLLGWPRGGVISGDEIEIALDNEPAQRGNYLLVLVTTLDRLLLRSKPFWNQSGASLRYSSVAYPPSRLGRYLFQILYGGAERNLPPESYRSRGAERISLQMSCPFTLDGQLFTPEPDRPVVLTGGETAQFVCV